MYWNIKQKHWKPLTLLRPSSTVKYHSKFPHGSLQEATRIPRLSKPFPIPKKAKLDVKGTMVILRAASCSPERTTAAHKQKSERRLRSHLKEMSLPENTNSRLSSLSDFKNRAPRNNEPAPSSDKNIKWLVEMSSPELLEPFDNCPITGEGRTVPKAL